MSAEYAAQILEGLAEYPSSQQPDRVQLAIAYALVAIAERMNA